MSSGTDGSMKIWQASNGELRVKAFGGYTYQGGLRNLKARPMGRRVAHSENAQSHYTLIGLYSSTC